MKNNILLSMTIFLSVMLSACGSDNNDNKNNDDKSGDQPQTGAFIDSPVAGVTYVAGDLTGVTDANGQFSYKQGGTVIFRIGDIVLGSASGAGIVTPVELVTGAADETNPTVTNLVRFLLTLDNDADPDNGVTITSGVTNLAVNKSINFNQSITDFENDGNLQTTLGELTAVTAAGARSLVPAAQAQNHLNGTLITLLAGDYTGNFSGGDTGTFSFTIHGDGTITGSGQGSDEAFTFTGSVNSDGSAAAGNVSTGASFAMKIVRDGTITGTWNNSIYSISGSLSGSKK